MLTVALELPFQIGQVFLFDRQLAGGREPVDEQLAVEVILLVLHGPAQQAVQLVADLLPGRL